MPLTFTTLGHVLLHVYDFDPGAAVYLPKVERYEADTPCVVALPAADNPAEEASLHRACLGLGFGDWLNVAVVSDTCDAARQRTEGCLVAAFNEDCREGGWLRRMMNYREPDSSRRPPT